MGTLYLVRHGQASFGTEDYDRLSSLGHRQCVALGDWMRGRGLVFEGVLRGTLRRHEQSLAAIGETLPGLPLAIEWPGLNEYDSEALIRTVQPDAVPPPVSAASARQHFRWLREALLLWMAGKAQPEGMPSWERFSEGIAQVLTLARERFEGDVLLVSSGGPISTAVGQVLGIPALGVVDLNMRLRNSAITEFQATPKRHALLSFNAIPHLDHPDRRGWESWA
jgi:broad specificity phosphatase PhoE